MMHTEQYKMFGEQLHTRDVEPSMPQSTGLLLIWFTSDSQ